MKIETQIKGSFCVIGKEGLDILLFLCPKV